MATATKKSAAKKAAAKPKVEETVESAQRVSAFDPEFIAEVAALRDDQEMNWKEIGSELDCVPGKAMLAYMVHTLPRKDKIVGKTDEELAPKIVAARDEDNHSWGYISARAGIPESKVRKLYQDATGVSSRGLRIGKGGRYPGDEIPAAVVKAKATAEKAAATKKAAAAKATASKKAAAAKTPAAKKAPAKKAAGGNPLLKMDLEGLQGRLNGKAITVERDGNKSKIKVKTVNGNEDGNLEFTDASGKARTVELVSIKAISR